MYMFCAICKFIQFRNCTTKIRNFIMANQFEIALPLLRIFEIVQERTTNLFFFWLEGKAHIWAKGRITGALKHTRFHPELEWWAMVLILSSHTILCHLSFEIVSLVSIGIAFFAKRFKTLSLIIDPTNSCIWSLLRLYRNLEIELLNFKIALHNFGIEFPFRNWLAIMHF